MLIPVILMMRLQFNWTIWKRMIAYSLPLLVAGMAGTVNDVIDKIMLRRIIGVEEGLTVVGQYGGGYKVAVLMSLFVQMFRFAAEPFFFEKAGKTDARETYAFVMRHFIVSAMILFLALNLFIPIVQYFVGPLFRESIVVVPIVSFAYLLYGVYLNLSVWYKINDMTRYGAYFTLAGAFFTVSINLVFIPIYGYMASAWAHVVCYTVMVVLSFSAGRRKYRIDYDVKGFLIYTAIAIGIVTFALYTEWKSTALELAVNTVLFGVFIAIAEKRDGTISLFFKRN
jgi:O-antigen/teichoic acid export membrane protein